MKRTQGESCAISYMLSRMEEKQAALVTSCSDYVSTVCRDNVTACDGTTARDDDCEGEKTKNKACEKVGEKKRNSAGTKNKRTTVTPTPFFISRIFRSLTAEAQHLQQSSLTGLRTTTATQSVEMALVSGGIHSSWTLSWQIQNVGNSGNSFQATMPQSRLIKWLILVLFDKRKRKEIQFYPLQPNTDKLI